VEYFPHFVNHKKTMRILEGKWGNDGYSFWFKLLELLGKTERHYYDCNKYDDWYYLQSYTKVDEDTAIEILNTLVRLEAIDPDLWEEKIIWCQHFVDNLSVVYDKRTVDLPQKPEFPERKQGFSVRKPSDNGVSGV
jgi:hypothetical protein